MQSPFEIVAKVENVNYRVQLCKKKPYQLYHLNLLKLWKDTELVIVLAGVRLEPKGWCGVGNYTVKKSKPMK